MDPRLDILFTLLSIIGILLFILGLAGIVTHFLQRKYYPTRQATYTKEGLTKREEAEEAGRRG